MLNRLRVLTERAYRRHLHREIEDVPTHVAIIQDGNRRYARERGDNAPDGHRAGAATTERVLDWCADLGVAELTLYAFSTENFERPDEELEPLFDLLETKLRDFADADRVHEQGSPRSRNRRCRPPPGARARRGGLRRAPHRRQRPVHAERRAGVRWPHRTARRGDGDRTRRRCGRPRPDRCRRRNRRGAAVRSTGPRRRPDRPDRRRRAHLELPPVARQRQRGGRLLLCAVLAGVLGGGVSPCHPHVPVARGVVAAGPAERAVALVRAVAEVEIAEAHAVAGRLRDRLPLDADALAAALPGDDEDAVEDRSEDGSPPETATENAGQTPTGERDAEPESAD